MTGLLRMLLPTTYYLLLTRYNMTGLLRMLLPTTYYLLLTRYNMTGLLRMLLPGMTHEQYATLPVQEWRPTALVTVVTTRHPMDSDESEAVIAWENEVSS